LKDWPDGGTGFALPGEHNRLNACAALAVADVLGLDLEQAAEALKGFRGAERRLQFVEGSPVPLFDDYAHHPTELVASISAIRERYPDRRIITAFQPHLYSRTQDNLEAFASALELADYVFITDIYPAREAPIPGISSARIAERIKKPVRYIPSRIALPRAIATEAGEGDVVLVMGAGDIDRIVPEILNELLRPFTGKTLVVYGGSSAEREVSILSANAVQQAMERLKIPATKIDIFDLLAREKSLELYSAENRPDVAFLAVHGTHAEDGAIQGLLEMLGVAYTGSGQRACTLAMDKQLAKLIVSKEGVDVPWGLMIRKGEPIPREVEFPLIVKPNSEGSSIGVSRVYDRNELTTALERLWETYEEVLIERLLVGTEISVPVLGSRALPAVELVPASGIYDFAAKYTPGATEEIVPARLPDEVLLKAQEVALIAHRALGCRGASRTDMIVADGIPWFLELNTLPGLTPTSILPRSAQAAGISFEELVYWIWADALRSHDLPVPEASR
jgi:D-alanine--D-alanine ligase